MNSYHTKLVLSFLWLYLVSALFGASILGAFVTTEPIPFFIALAGLSGWLIWRAIFRVVVYCVCSGLLYEALVEAYSENSNGKS